MFRFTIRDLLWLTVVVGMGVALLLSTQRQGRLLRELEESKRDSEKVNSDYIQEKYMSHRMKWALLRELEKHRGPIAGASFHQDRNNREIWHADVELAELNSEARKLKLICIAQCFSMST